jgi:hypothetical protein
VIRHPRRWLIAIGVLVLLLIAVVVFANIYTNLLFYRSVGFSEVYDTVLITKIVLFFVVGILFAGVVCANVVVAYRLRPAYRPDTPDQRQLDEVRAAVAPYRLLILIAVTALLGLISGLSGAGRWRTVLLWLNGRSFHLVDPQFHRDIGYYVFDYPFERAALGFAFAALLVSLVVAVGVHVFYAGIRPRVRGDRVVPAARAHLSVLLGLLVLLKAAFYYLDRFGLNFSPRGSVTGAGYSDVHATLPAKTVLLVVAVICAVLFFVNVFRRGFALPGIALGLLVFSALVIGGVYPAIVQDFTVKPNELNLEAPYIQRNINATQAAYQIGPQSKANPGGVVYQNSGGSAVPSVATVAKATSAIPHARLLDPNDLQSTFEQLQQIRAYYSFPRTLGIDRYTIDGTEQEYLVGVRDIDLTGLPSGENNWPNEHLIYTHGDGFVAAAVSSVTTQGKPVFSDGNIPPSSPSGGAPAIPISQPRVYFGENSPTYSIVHTTQDEIDGAGGASYSYTADGGVSIGSEFRRVLFAVHFGDRNIVLSSSLTSKSRILYYRDPVTRVHMVAPWLTLDSDPYPAVINGQITWILDGYTTTDMYPYSERTSLAGATYNTFSAGNTGGQINYIRNSVKATVNAFTGKVTLYAWDPSDPILQTWEKIFPGTVQPRSAIPAALMAHFRYPEDLFDVQRSLLIRYHISNARTFYRGNDFWSVPTDPSNHNQTPQPPYYELMQVPGQSQAEFDLTTDLVANGRPNLAAFVSVSSDAPDYGTLRVIQLPTGTGLPGPAIVSNTIETDRVVSSALTLLRSGGSRTISGNLLTIPLDGGFLFIEPFYVQATGSSQTFPTLQDVAVYAGGNVGFAPTLSEALVQVLGAAPPGTEGGAVQATGPSTTGPSTGRGSSSAAVRALVVTAQQDYTKAQADLRAGDFAAYGAEETKLSRTLAQLASATDTSVSGKSGSSHSSGSHG